MNKYNNPYSQEDLKFLKEKYSIENKETIMRYLNRGWSSIVVKANSLGLKRKGLYCKANLNKLLEDTIETYYWMGLLVADGNFTNHSLDICLNNKDIKTIKDLSVFLECEDCITQREKYNQSRLCIANKPIVFKIKEKFDIQNNKTKNPPHIEWMEEDFLFSFIIGFIDGDGSIRKKTGKGRSKGSCRLTIQCHDSWLTQLKFIQNFLYNYFKIKKNGNKKDPQILTQKGEYKISSLQLGDMRLLSKMKKRIEELQLSEICMNRKWSQINSDYENPQTQKAKMKIDFISKIPMDNRNFKDISKQLEITETHAKTLIKRVQYYE